MDAAPEHLSKELSDLELFRIGVGPPSTCGCGLGAVGAFRMLADVDGVTSLGQVTDQRVSGVEVFASTVDFMRPLRASSGPLAPARRTRLDPAD